MSVSKFFAPYCIKPIYMIDSPDSAGNCGFISGLIYSFIFTLTIIIAGIKFYSSEKDPERRRYILYAMGISITLLWILCPILSYYSHKIIWKGYNDAKRDLQSQGYSKMEILNILQLFEQNSASLNVGGLGRGMMFANSQPNQSTQNDQSSQLSRELQIKSENTI